MTTASTETSLAGRLKSRLALVQAQIDAVETRASRGWGDLPARLRGALHELARRLREGLDLPSQTEVSELAERLAEIDRKLARFEERRASDAGTIARLEKSASEAMATAREAASQRGASGGGKKSAKPKKAGASSKDGARSKSGSANKNGASKDGASRKNASAKNGASSKGGSAKNGASSKGPSGKNSAAAKGSGSKPAKSDAN